MHYLSKFWSMFTSSLSLLKGFFQMIYGSWKISELEQPTISIFGGSRLQRESIYINFAHKLAHILVDNNISIITGGGPGIMEAANFGASHRVESGKIRSFGIGVRGLKGEEGLNPYVKQSMMLDYFFARKYLLIYYSIGYVVFPGGYGTIDELAELLTLMQTEKIKRGPVILIGISFWQPFLELLEAAKTQGLLDRGIIDIITTDDVEYAASILVEHCKARKNTADESPKKEQ